GEECVNRKLVDVACANRLPILATNGVQYAKPYGRQVLDVFTCIREHTHLDVAGKLLTRNSERHLKSDREMRELFRDLPEAIENTARLAERLTFSLENLGYEFPEFPVPDGHSMDSFLRTITWFGAQQRYAAISSAVKRQLEKELALIQKLGFPGYFLIVWDIVNFCREHNVMVQGRGSAANSAVCYCLGITPVDPVSNNLVFERFLSEGRQGWPDIDLDLPSGDRRESVIQEIYRRYGKHGAPIIPSRRCSCGRLENAMRPGRVVAQWDKGEREQVSIGKVHFLGLARMSVMQDALELCSDRGRPFNLAHIPQEPPATFEIMQTAD